MVDTGVAPGVSAAATSSARWQRMLEPSSRDARAVERQLKSGARTTTFIVGPEASPGADGVTANLNSGPAADRTDGLIVELAGVHAPASLERVQAALAVARTGWRFRVIGDESALGALRAQLHDAGVLDEEITLVLAEPTAAAARVPVFCGHCQAKTLGPGVGARAGAGAGTVVCSGCGRVLTVAYHHSRRQGAYLGYFADAELGPA
ncbi:dimethylamine monooxygenase subunit DmmA family protein [Pseudoclavibacter helvolus]|uniref:dimethylamine monooxygenase subunit DmmA family protein n=1 Tax=Pseudoclavibacter helvolus TaxID=255205 RepID=UPI003C78FF69